MSGGIINNGSSPVARAFSKVLMFNQGSLIPLTSIELAIKWQANLLLQL